MIEEDVITKIKKLIDRGKSNYKIGKELGHSANTIKKYREKYIDAGMNQETQENIPLNDPIEWTKQIIRDIENLIKYGQLNTADLKKWGKINKNLREILRTEVDDRIEEERAHTIQEQDNEWRTYLQKNYVPKEEARDLKKTLKEKEETILNLRNAVTERDEIINVDNREKEDLKHQIWALNAENWNLHDYIDKSLNNDILQWQQERNHQQEELHREKTDLHQQAMTQQLQITEKLSELNKKQKAVELHDEKLVIKEGNLKKREESFNEEKIKMNRILEESINVIEKRAEDVTQSEKRLKICIDEQVEEMDTERKKIKDDQEKIKQELKVINKTVAELKVEEHRLQEWQKNLNNTRGLNKFSLPCPHCEKPMLFDANNQEIYQKISQTFGKYTHPECRPQSKQQKHVILRPVSLSGESVMQSGFPIICSGEEPIVVQTSGEPVVQSGCPPVYYSGIKVFDKN